MLVAIGGNFIIFRRSVVGTGGTGSGHCSLIFRNIFNQGSFRLRRSRNKKRAGGYIGCGDGGISGGILG